MGNKKKLINKGIIELFPIDIDTFIEPFAGSAIVAMNTIAKKYVISDKDSNLYRLYRLFKENKASAIINHINKQIDNYGLARERTKRNEFKDKDKIEQYKTAYMNFRTDYNANKNDLDFYTLMFYSFSQQFRFNSKGNFNMPCGNDCFSELNKTYIHNGCNFFSKDNVKIGCNDYSRLNIDLLNINDFVYLDPPYNNTTATYNENNGWNDKNEDNLYDFCQLLDDRKIRWAMSNVFENKNIKNTKLIDWVHKRNYNTFSFDKFTYMACGKGNGNAKEVLITNYIKDGDYNSIKQSISDGRENGK